ncbi:MAG: hypothetical protein PHU85_14410, partial [Phycisphaerae bacterium]|nr:hypothetical protein [Phycisphaerae bacterium]
MRTFLALTWVATIAGIALADASFTEQPAVTQDGGKTIVKFAVSEATDVAVTVREESGRAVRHLAAGRLGPKEKAPPPLQADSLKQQLIWDGTDDAGRAVAPGQYRIEVAIGLTPKFDKLFGFDPKAIEEVHGLAIGPKGSLYVLSSPGRDTQDGRFLILTGQGEYVRTIMPRPGNLPAERVAPFDELTLDDGTRVPRTMLPYYEWRSWQEPLVMPDGDLVFATAAMRSEVYNGTRYSNRLLGPGGKQKPFERRLLRLAADGGAPLKAGFVGPSLGTNMEGMICLAASPDRATIYISGARHAVFAATWDEDAKLVALIGTPDQPGSGEAGLKDPAGLDTNAEGNIYVADRGNHRVAVFSARGKLVGQLKVEWPQFVRVSPAGALYVVAGFKERTLLKFDTLAAEKPSASMPLGLGRPYLAMDKTPGANVLFVANVNANANAANRGGRLMRIEDGQDGLKATAISVSGELLQPTMIGMDRPRDLVYAKSGMFSQYIRFDGRSGRAERFALPLDPKSNGIHEMSVAADGTVLAHVANEFARLDAMLRPLPFTGLGG